MDKNNNIIPKMIRKNSSANKTKKRENITIIPAKFNDTFNRVPLKETYCKLVMLADESGTVIIRIRTLANILNTNEKTISRNLKELHIRGLIIKDKIIDEYGYQKMIIHVVNYNKLAEKISEKGQDIPGQIINKHFYETLPKSNEMTKDFYDLPKKIQESGSPYNEIQKFDKIIKTDNKSAHASEHDIILTNQPSLPSHKPTASVSDSAVFDICEKTINQTASAEDYNSLLKCLMGFNMPEQQARNLIEKYSYDVVMDKVNYVRRVEGVSNKGGYLTSVLKAYGKRNGLSPLAKPKTLEEKQALKAKEKLAQAHLLNIRKWFSKNYLTIESHINNPLVDQKYIIFELSKILQGNVLAGKNETVNELLNDELITIGRLHKLCDQLMSEEQTNQEASKNIVSAPVENANEVAQQQEPKNRSHTPMSLNERLAKVNRDLTNTIVGKTSLSINQKKGKTAAEKEEHADLQKQLAEAILANKSLPTGGFHNNEAVSEAVSEAVPGQLNQGFIQNSEAVKINSEAVNEAVKPQSWCGENLTKLTDRQKQIIEVIKNTDKPSKKDIIDLAKISKSSVERELKVLLKIGIIEAHGYNRFTYYCLTTKT